MNLFSSALSLKPKRKSTWASNKPTVIVLERTPLKRELKKKKLSSAMTRLSYRASRTDPKFILYQKTFPPQTILHCDPIFDVLRATFLTFFVTKFRLSCRISHEKLIFRFTSLAVIIQWGLRDWWLIVCSLLKVSNKNELESLFFLYLDFFLSSTTFLRGVATFSSTFYYVFHFYLLISFNSSCYWNFCGCYGLKCVKNSKNIL